MMIETFWSLVPAFVAIALALITKEVYSSLFAGIVLGGVFYTIDACGGFSVFLTHVTQDGFVSSLSDSYNVGILIFLVILGIMVALMNKAGGSAAFGKWAQKHIKTKIGAQIATIILGILIFIDDYFNCLTVGSVMMPVTDKHRISRAKLAYIIDATAAPICIIAPVSSWAAAVSGFVEGANGLELFIRAIPYNFYAFLSIVMIITISKMNFDYGPMSLVEMTSRLEESKKHVESPTKGEDQPDPPISANGKVIHLVLPIVVLIASSVIGLIYSGGFFAGESFIDAFSNADASVGLSIGSIFALIFTIIFYLCTRVLNFSECMNAIPEGFKSMVPAILILTFAWSLKAMTDSLGARDYVAGIVAGFAGNHAIMSLIPAIVFIIGALLAFATGTSWGTFGVLIPIVVSVFGGDMGNELMIVSISACMAGAVCGDHCSPISDTTIMASAGAECDHIQHVSTQLPYAITVAIVSCVCYIFSGFIRNWVICLPLSIILMVATLMVMKNFMSAKSES